MKITRSKGNITLSWGRLHVLCNWSRHGYLPHKSVRFEIIWEDKDAEKVTF